MIKSVKIIVSLCSGFVVLFFLTTIISILSQFSDLIALASALPFALYTTWVTWRASSKKRISTGMYCFSSALVIGAISFSLGFFGPLIFFPEANQGPLLGLFITGPLGTIIGAVVGFIYAQKQAL